MGKPKQYDYEFHPFDTTQEAFCDCCDDVVTTYGAAEYEAPRLDYRIFEIGNRYATLARCPSLDDAIRLVRALNFPLLKLNAETGEISLVREA